MNITRSKISFIYIVITISLLAIISISSFIASANTEAELDSVVNEIIPLSNTAEQILSDLVNMETGVRGYETTLDEQYLTPYENGKLDLQADLDQMALFQKKYPRLGSIMQADILPAIQRLDVYYSAQINLLRTGQKDEAAARIASGKTMMDRFRQLHTKLQAEIEEIARTAYQQAHQAELTSRIIVISSGVLAVLVGAISFFIFARANKAEAELRKSEETYRYMAESLESQNEEIIAQQEEQELTLEKLSQRELELAAISGYQEKLAGAVDMHLFLEAAIPALTETLQADAAALVVRDPNSQPAAPRYKTLYALGYPMEIPEEVYGHLIGPAERTITRGEAVESRRDAIGLERGIHSGIEAVTDRYYPIFDNRQHAIGFLLLTSYRSGNDEQINRLAKGLIRQFGLAFMAQQLNEERRLQSDRLELLNEQLLQEKHLIEEQRRMIENILESTHEGMIMCDAQGKVQFSNRRMQEFFPAPTGRPLADICAELQTETPSFLSTSEAIDGLLRGQLSTLSERFALRRSEEGQERYIELYATAIGERTGEDTGFLFVFRDRTEEEKVDELKNEFISIVSHELRTPLASVLGFIEILLHRKLTPEKQQRYMQTIYKEATRLSTLINDFLDLQRMEAGKQTYHFAPLELGSALRDVTEQWRGRQGHRVELTTPEEEIWVRADADRFKQVAHNLLSNAIKYSPDADVVDVVLRMENGKVRLDIRDYGLGIPDEAKGKLFTKFYRVDNSDRRQIGGTGLGLSIVKEIVEAHHGQITFESEMGKGSTFSIQLETYQIRAAEDAILLLEDDDNLARLVQITLNKLGLPIIHVRSAEEAILSLQRVVKDGPRLCIVDLHLEGTRNGWEFIGELYRHPQFYRTPVIVSTALEPPLDYQEKDIEKYLRKPFTMDKLLSVSEQLLSLGQTHPAYVFPKQDEAMITETLAKNGIEIGEMTIESDLIQVEPKPKPTGQA